MKCSLLKLPNFVTRLLSLIGVVLLSNTTLCSAKVAINEHTFYDLKETAKELGMKLKWIKPQEEAVLSDNNSQVVVQKEKRYVMLDNTQVWLTESIRQRGSKLLICKDDVENVLLPVIKPQRFKAKCPKLYRIVIDPGHGSKDHGTINKELKIEEKTMALDVAKRLQRILQEFGYEVLMTRSDDTFVELEDRPRYANKKNADLFLSIHFNAAANPNASGVETYAMTLKDHRSTGGQPSDALQHEIFTGNKHDTWNALAGYAIQKHLQKELRCDDRGLKRARFRVLRYLDCPGLLIEAGFMTNPSDADKIKTPTHREHIAQSIAKGVMDYQKALNQIRKKTV